MERYARHACNYYQAASSSAFHARGLSTDIETYGLFLDKLETLRRGLNAVPLEAAQRELEDILDRMSEVGISILS